MTEWAAKRFWDVVDVVANDAFFAVHLDDRPLRTPAKAKLLVPSRAAAELVAQEWRDQGQVIDPGSMPATRTANVAIDKVAQNMEAVARNLVEYGSSDLLCYRAAGPQELVARQNALWDPILDWAATTLGAPLIPVEGVMPVDQPPASIATLAEHVTVFNAFALSAFYELVSLSGSLILALAVAKKRLSAEEAWALSRLDEQFQQEQWGEDAEATQAAKVKQDAFLLAARFLGSVA